MLALLSSVALTAGEARAASMVWNDGSPSRFQHRCVLGLDLVNQIEDITWTWVGFQGLPVVGQTYYMRVMVGGLGCSGAWVVPAVTLPKGTQFAISAQNPVVCFYQKPGQANPLQVTDGSCPAQPSAAPYSASASYSMFQPATQAVWALPPGVTLTIAFPVTSSQPLSGIASNDYLAGATYVIDNNPGGTATVWDAPPPGWNQGGIPSTGAWQGVFVTSSAYTGPRITYPEPAVTMVTTTAASTSAYVYNSACVSPQQVIFTLDIADPGVPNPGITFLGGACPAMPDGGFNCTVGWNGLLPDHLYKYHCNFDPPSLAACGAVVQDQGEKFFRTKPLPGAARYTLMAHADGDGSITLSPNDGLYPPGTVVSATANGSLTKWTLDGVDAGTVSPLAITMDSAHTLVATFPAASGKKGWGCDLSPTGSAELSAILLALAASAAALRVRRRRG
jgi:hypothetical protein